MNEEKLEFLEKVQKMFKGKQPVDSITVLVELLSTALLAYEMKFDVDLTDIVLAKIKSSGECYRNVLKNLKL